VSIDKTITLDDEHTYAVAIGEAEQEGVWLAEFVAPDGHPANGVEAQADTPLGALGELVEALREHEARGEMIADIDAPA
jgi:hypothetical protein